MGAKGDADLAGVATTERLSTAVEKSPGPVEKHVQLSGTDARSLDDRGRLSIPTKYRWAFEDGLAIVPWPGPSIALIPTAEFVKIVRQMRKKQREMLGDGLARDALTELASHSFLDAQGRIFLDAVIREEAHIDGDLLLIGRLKRIELWAPDSREAGREARRQALAAHIEAEGL